MCVCSWIQRNVLQKKWALFLKAERGSSVLTLVWCLKNCWRVVLLGRRHLDGDNCLSPTPSSLLSFNQTSLHPCHTNTHTKAHTNATRSGRFAVLTLNSSEGADPPPPFPPHTHTHTQGVPALCFQTGFVWGPTHMMNSVIEREFHSCKPVNTNWSEEEERFNKFFFCGSRHTGPSKIAAEFTWVPYTCGSFNGYACRMFTQIIFSSGENLSNCSIFGPDLSCRTLLLLRLINVYHTWRFNQNRTYEVYLIVSGNLTRTNLVLLFRAYLFDCFSQIAAYKDNSTDWLLDVH